MGAYFSLMGVPLSAITRPMHNRYWEADIKRTREVRDTRVLSTREPIKHILTDIRKGRAVVFLVDQDARKNGVFVDFFEHPASTFAGPALLMQRFNVPILPFYTFRTSLTTHKVVFKPPIYPRPENDGGVSRDDIVSDIVQEYTKFIEATIREVPEQYFWFHRRWKSKPKKKKPGNNNPQDS
jgi:KDO2-lipid IV(A) lauroyltransferase